MLMSHSTDSFQFPKELEDLLLTCIEDRTQWIKGFDVLDLYDQFQVKMLDQLKALISKTKINNPTPPFTATPMNLSEDCIQIPKKYGDLLLTCVEDRIHWMSGIVGHKQYYRQQMGMLKRMKALLEKQK